MLPVSCVTDRDTRHYATKDALTSVTAVLKFLSGTINCDIMVYNKDFGV